MVDLGPNKRTLAIVSVFKDETSVRIPPQRATRDEMRGSSSVYRAVWETQQALAATCMHLAPVVDGEGSVEM